MAVYRILHGIYEKQWSTSNLPDVLEGTRPLLDIEDAFGISIDEGEALELYDMMLDEAASRIAVMKQRQR